MKIKLFTIDGIKKKHLAEPVLVKNFQSLQNAGKLYFYKKFTHFIFYFIFINICLAYNTFGFEVKTFVNKKSNELIKNDEILQFFIEESNNDLEVVAFKENENLIHLFDSHNEYDNLGKFIIFIQIYLKIAILCPNGQDLSIYLNLVVLN